MPSRTTLDEVNDTVQASEGSSMEVTSQASSDPNKETGDSPPASNAMNVSDDEDTFESLDRVAPLQWPRGVSETFTAEDFTYGEVTVLDDEDDESASDDSSEEAFIEVNHDDASVVSTLTVETALERKVKKKKKKKSKKKGKKSSRKVTSSMIPEKIEEEEDECSKSETSERTQKTSKTMKTFSSKKSKAKATDDVNSLDASNVSHEEIVEVNRSSPVESHPATKKTIKGILPALSTLDTISTQPNSTNAVAGSFKRSPPRTSGESDTASQSPPPVPRKSDHSSQSLTSSPKEGKSIKNVTSSKKSSPSVHRPVMDSKDQTTISVKADPPIANIQTANTTSNVNAASPAVATESVTIKPASTNNLTNASPERSSKVKSSSSHASVMSSVEKPASTNNVKAAASGTSRSLAGAAIDKPEKDKNEGPEIFQEPSSQIERAAQSHRKMSQNTAASSQKASQPPLPPRKAHKVSASSPATKTQSASQQKQGTIARLPVTSVHSEPGVNRSGIQKRLDSVVSTPGAYRVQGSDVRSAADDFTLSPSTVATRTIGKSKKGKLKPPSSMKNLVVAAELSDDVEAQIEQEVRRRILADAVQADLVSMDDDSGSLKRESLPSSVVDRRVVDLKEVHKPKGVKERLFGDNRQNVDIAASPESIRKRDYLQWTVKRNPAAQWVASVTTNQKAMEENDDIEMQMSQVAFAAKTQQEAYEVGLSSATPLMLSFDENPICNVCKAKFAMFRRPLNCRNCGVCICSGCTTTWPSKMLPSTYLNKRDKSTVSVCSACDWIAHSFQNALLKGDYTMAVDLFKTGNVNLRTPYCLDKKAGALYPIHMATMGGNLKLVRWLTSERFCPLQTINLKKKVNNHFAYDPIVTSKGLTALEIALINRRIDIVHFFVSEMKLSISDQKNVSTDIVLANLTSLLNMLPSNFFEATRVVERRPSL